MPEKSKDEKGIVERTRRSRYGTKEWDQTEFVVDFNGVVFCPFATAQKES